MQGRIWRGISCKGAGGLGSVCGRENFEVSFGWCLVFFMGKRRKERSFLMLGIKEWKASHQHWAACRWSGVQGCCCCVGVLFSRMFSTIRCSLLYEPSRSLPLENPRDSLTGEEGVGLPKRVRSNGLVMLRQGSQIRPELTKLRGVTSPVEELLKKTPVRGQGHEAYQSDPKLLKCGGFQAPEAASPQRNFSHFSPI